LGAVQKYVLSSALPSQPPHLSGWGNEELQEYARENASVFDGVLHLTAAKEGCGYKSAKICTKGKRDFCPGASTPNGIRIEARIKLPKGGCLAWFAFNKMIYLPVEGKRGGGEGFLKVAGLRCQADHLCAVQVTFSRTPELPTENSTVPSP